MLTFEFLEILSVYSVTKTIKMKTIKTLGILFLLSITVSCDEIDELTEFDTSFTLNESITISVPEGEEVQTFSQNISLNLAEDQDVADNLSAIEEVSIQSLTYRYTDVTGNDEAQISNAQFMIAGTTIDVESVNPTEAQGTIFTINDQEVLDAFSNALRNNPEGSIMYTAQVQGAPVSFVVEVELEVTVTIDPV